MENTKPVLINSGATKPGARYKWDSMGDFIKDFTKEIKSSLAEREGQKPNIGNAVSGLPSAFARASMFAYALNSPAVEGPTSGLNVFYSAILDEWKGLISSFVLEQDSTAFKVRRVWLVYSDADGTIEKTNHVYEPKGAFGNALFNRAQLWEDQDNIGDPNRLKKPFIDIIYYKGMVVGGTSPESLVFTAPSYRFEGADRQKIFVSEISGKFINPVTAEGKISAEDLNKLYTYVEKITKRIVPFFSKYQKSRDLWPNDRVDQNIGTFLKNWMTEIKDYATDHKITLNAESKPEVTLFDLEPFKTLFNSVNSYYANFQGEIFSDEIEGVDSSWISFRVEELLLQPETTVLARIDVDDTSSLPFTPLEVDFQGTKLYFTVPLSPLGLKVFQRVDMSKLLKGTDSKVSSLIALYNAQDNVLNVKLELKSDGRLIATTPTVPYKINSAGSDAALGLKQLVAWPNFVSNIWAKYYLYSEMPHNTPTGWQVFPILGNIDDVNGVVEVMDKEVGKKIGLKETELPADPNGFIKLAVDGKSISSLGKLVVGNIKALSTFKYEIYESSKPFRGIEIYNSGKSSGYLFLNYGGISDSQTHIAQLPKNRSLTPTRVGIDFGSNNSCVAYNDGSTMPQLLQFKNRRVSFFTSDSLQNESNSVRPADTFEMLFFQNDEPMSNKIKSVLTIHEETRLIDDKGSGNLTQLYEEVVKGGFTCYESNIAIEDSTPNRHILSMAKIPDQKVQLVYNMKWSNEDRENSHKIAYLKSLLLQTYAELFMRREGPMYPKTLAWAYPAAMSISRIRDYSTKIWSKLIDTNPLTLPEAGLEVLQGSLAVQSGRNTLGGGDSTTMGGMAGGMGGMTGGLGGMTGGMGGMTGGMGGMTGGMGGMTGGMGGMTGGMGGMNPQVSPSQMLKDLELPDEIEAMLNPSFQPTLIGKPVMVNPQKAMTESQAVACFASTETQAGQFVLGFDVGGSTTDLLAVTGISSPMGGYAAALVKQNSIKLAAGVLADATKLIPGFNLFLKDYASSKIGKIYGIDNMSPNTTPFFFNVVLDRLTSKSDLDDFYRNIAANSKPLMWLNLYVTGLNIFYGGMVAKKLHEHTVKNPGLFLSELNSVKVDFFGKGSRIFDWYKALDKESALLYFAECFAKGFGEQEAYSRFQLNVNFRLGNFDDFSAPTNQDEVKTEVAKGLAKSDYPIFEFANQVSEIAGEDGYMLRIAGQQQPVLLGSLMDINPSLMQRLGSELLPPQPGPNAYPRFVSFMNTFYNYASQTLDFKVDGSEILRAISSMNVLADLRNDDDYKEAIKNGKDFDFVAPLIILQGQAFLRSYLLPKIQKG